MSSKKDRYKKMVEVYSELGKKYLKDIEKLVPVELSGFIKLLPKGGRVLDVGCGGGRDSKRFVERGFEVIGIDLVDVFLGWAQKNVPEAKFIKMDLLDLKFPKDYFDGIWAQAVLLHISKKDIAKALKGFCRVLKPGGKLHVRVKRGKGVSSQKEKLSGGKKRIFTYFLKDEMEKFVKKAGFKVMSSKVVPDELRRKGVKWIAVWASK